jgi:glycine dehydrogenase
MVFAPSDRFANRHLGPSNADREHMLGTVGALSLEALVDEVVPADIRLAEPLALPAGMSEQEYLRHIAVVGRGNKSIRSYIGLGYHDTVTPSVILRMVMENPGWYTPYTPYQAEIAQGRLESLINFQTMVTDLTGMEVANASLLDEATAAAEAMTLLHRVRPAARHEAHRFLVSDGVFPQTIAVLRSRAEPLGLDLVVKPVAEMVFDENVFGAYVQYPDESGAITDWHPFIKKAQAAGALVAMGSDLLALTILKPPGEMGADVVVGNTQRFGVPLGFGGPHAAFFATRKAFVRQIPGRLIGVSMDAHHRPAYRMSLATREQHIRREKATSNICTAQALLANMAAMYAVYHGPTGIRAIAGRVHRMAATLETSLTSLGLVQVNPHFFDTIRVRVPGDAEAIRQRALWAGINFRYEGDHTVVIALNETVLDEDLLDVVNVFAEAVGHLPFGQLEGETIQSRVPDALRRTTPYLTHPVFNAHHSETAMMRYIRSLERKDIGLDTSMIPLGSCTMKLNAAAAMRPVTWEAFARVHPFAPLDQAMGYLQVIEELEGALVVVTGLSKVSLQPNSGAQGELAGLMAIRAYHRAQGEISRDTVLIPASAHGTNPASAAMAGLRVVVVATSSDGSVDLDDLRAKAGACANRLSCLMITYPSTHGVYEPDIRMICNVVHAHGGQVYMDGANMNAQIGLTSPASIGADVCHLNLHKTFSIPHGGGGPGVGPIAVAEHLAPYLPGHPMAAGSESAIGPVAAAPWGSASILLIPYGYIRMLGAEGLADVSRVAILSANYIKARLAAHYPVLYSGPGGRVAHELIFDLRGFKAAGIDESDVAKRLIDFGFHAPTVSFPVAGTLMVEPTESENLAELDRFCDALIHIRGEIEAVMSGRGDATNNVLKHAPHTAAAVSVTDWLHPYSREEAAYPLPFVAAAKFWPPVGRVDNPYGDRNLFCACVPVGQ